MLIKTRIKKPLILLTIREFISTMTLAKNTNAQKQVPTLSILTCLEDLKKYSIRDKKMKSLRCQYLNQWPKEVWTK
jgi:hypothetical protein